MSINTSGIEGVEVATTDQEQAEQRADAQLKPSEKILHACCDYKTWSTNVKVHVICIAFLWIWLLAALPMFLGIADWQNGTLRYSYHGRILATDTNTTVYSMSTDYACGADLIEIQGGEPNEEYAISLSGYYLNNLLGKERGCVTFDGRTNINPDYNQFDRQVATLCICVGCQLMFVVGFAALLIKKRFVAISVSMVSLVACVLFAVVGVLYVVTIKDESQSCRIGLQPFLEQQIGSKWNDGYSWLPYTQPEKLGPTYSCLKVEAIGLSVLCVYCLLVIIALKKNTDKNDARVLHDDGDQQNEIGETLINVSGYNET